MPIFPAKCHLDEGLGLLHCGLSLGSRDPSWIGWQSACCRVRIPGEWTGLPIVDKLMREVRLSYCSIGTANLSKADYIRYPAMPPLYVNLAALSTNDAHSR